MLLFQHTAFVSFIYNTERGMKAELLSIIYRGEKKKIIVLPADVSLYSTSFSKKVSLARSLLLYAKS